MNANGILQTHATDILAHAREAGVTTLRLLGGVAIRRLYPAAGELPGLRRDCKDIDFAVGRRDAKGLRQVFTAAGFEPDRPFNALHGVSRQLYMAGGLQADVFVGVFEQCHRLPLEARLGTLPETLSPADLVLMKLQVVQMNEKDLQDLCVLLLGADLGGIDGPEVIHADYIAGVTAEDWGWYTTCSDSLEKLEGYAQERLPGPEGAIVAARVEELKRRMEDRPKSLKWRMRSALGRRVQWYDLPEEARR